MNKTKTARDLNTYQGKYVDLEDLRNEAINWIKELSKINSRKGEIFEMPGYAYEEYEATQVIMWIRHFFNIKDEELK